MSLDRRLFRLLHTDAGGYPILDRPLFFCARYGSYLEIALMLMVGVKRGRAGRLAVARCLRAVGVIYLLAKVMGLLAERPRPFVGEPGARAYLRHSAGRSFPSRHVASAAAMSVIVRRASSRTSLAMGWLTALMALGRVRAGLHYPTDVAAGTLLGSLVGRALR